MSKINFNEKIICDNAHGSVGISKIEQKIINPRTFQRLKKINHLGLANLVFPGAEHSRFAHSIGVMHLMSLMIDQLKGEGCSYLKNDSNNKIKQKLRLAALLHDIGHFPLSHLGERVFKWVDVVKKPTRIEKKGIKRKSHNLLENAAKNHKSSSATHEKLGEIILTECNNEIQKILEENDFDPAEIARIFNAEEEDNLFYNQLMSSTLDCDRLDYMLRDSIGTGTCYGKVDLEYILRNLSWDKKEKKVCFLPKAMNAIEHFITNRFFYYNIIYHKTIMGFELMAKALFYAMIMKDDFNEGSYGGIVHSFEDIKEKMKKEKNFLANFNDEYFWYYLELYKPKYQQVEKKLRENLLSRIPIRPIYSVRALKSESKGAFDKEYNHLTKSLFESSEFEKTIKKHNLQSKYLAIIENKIKFEEIEYAINYKDIDKIDDHDKLKLVKIKTQDGLKELISFEGSIIRILSEYKPHIATLYALVERNSEAEKSLIKVAKNQWKKHKEN